VDRTRLATISLHISAVFYMIAGALLVLAPFARDSATTAEVTLHSSIIWLLAVLAFALAALARVLIRALRQRKRWAWITATVLFTLYLPTVFLPLGAVGLFGLLSEGTRAQFPVTYRRH
jgi:cytochrome bd-type quinol oxidase subunit 2